MSPTPSFDSSARLGRLTLLMGAYAPALVILGLRHGLDSFHHQHHHLEYLGVGLCAAGLAGTAWWAGCLLQFVKQRQRYELTLKSSEPADRDVTAYVASYLLPILAAKPGGLTGYLAYGLAAALILVVAYRADLGAINPLAYLLGYRAYRVSADDGVRIVLSRWLLKPDTTWQVQEFGGMVVSKSQVTTPSTEIGDGSL